MSESARPYALEKDSLSNMDFGDAMFAWSYTKTLDDGKDYWVVGTSCNTGKVKDYQDYFYKYIQKKFNLSGEIVKKEGFATNIDWHSKNRVWLGTGNILMIGDAAGLVDQARGMGMDVAAISGRLVAKAIIKAEKQNGNALKIYTKLMRKITKQTIVNQSREIKGFDTNEELTTYVKNKFAKTSAKFMVNLVLNKFRKLENFVLLPPTS